MKISSAEFVTSAGKPPEYPVEELPEIAFAGRSNVGKSSLMNALLNRKKLVKTSSTPGKTQRINYFLINESFFFVDLPGYGYAKVPKVVRNQWGPMMNEYFRVRKSLRLVVCLVDARRGLAELDGKLMQLLEQNERHRLLVFTKIDKLKKNERNNFSYRIKNDYGLAPEEYIAVSSMSRKGIEKLWSEIEVYLSDIPLPD